MDSSRRDFLALFPAASAAALALTHPAVPRAASPAGGSVRGRKPPSLLAAPRFSRLDGTPIDLAGHVGQPLLVNLWATWCPPCVAELPSLQRLRDARQAAPAGDRLEVLALNVGQSINQVESFLASLGSDLTLPIVLDSERHALAYWRVKVLPTTLVFDAHGSLRTTVTGERDWASAESAATIAAALRP